MKLTDTHSHLYDTAFDADREEALARAAAAGDAVDEFYAGVTPGAFCWKR